jgi:transcriptional regulator with GAF, ATPase, and Fis domain
MRTIFRLPSQRHIVASNEISSTRVARPLPFRYTEGMQDVLDYTSDLHALASMVAERATLGDVLARALDALGALVPHDLAVVYRLDEARLRAVAASGPLATPAVRNHELRLARFPTIRRALELRQPIALTEHHHAGDEGDPYDGLLDLPHGHACMVVPLFAGPEALGIITLDGTACGRYPPEHVRLAGIYGQIVSLAVVLSEQAGLLDRYRLQLREHTRLLLEDAGGADVACQRLERSRSAAVRELAAMARQVASSHLPVLIQGETGTGKEVLAQALHAWSARADGPFVKLNCSAMPENLVESELFGHVKGAFSGADRERRGRFLTANGGSLLLDEIGDMPLAAQAKLLRVLQEGTFEPVGSDRPVRVDVRVLAATHVDLKRAVREGRFREDLYYRLAVFPLRLPPLRERPEDALAIADTFLDETGRRTRRGPWMLPPATRDAITAAPWPGNVRELVNALERATILCAEGPLSAGHLGLAAPDGAAPRPNAAVPTPPDSPTPGEPPALPDWQENERRYFVEVLRRTGGRLHGPNGAAAIARLKPTTLRSRLVKLGLR